jgi:hypothetical protein
VARTKGAIGKIPGDLKELVLLALHKRGGLNYLIGLDDGIFVKLLCMIIPKQVAHSGVINGVQVHIHSNLAMGNNPKLLNRVAEDEEIYESASIVERD